ncbi:uncharacterized protein LOC107841372 [Capsicum annuum]|uniref:uncharacterized protein LOC107841372 n=1 Tax=Capsicum annuum TaxID=4072 RepID=UPI001FB19DCC|nr:uncharacterized protein LOC107841372 [Capsicum annuum]
MNVRRQDWSWKLDDALWAYRIVFNTPISMSPYQLVYGKAYHLPIELEYKVLWALRRLNLNWNEATELRLRQLNEIDEFCLSVYEREDLYKEKMKKYHDRRIVKREFLKGDWVLLFNCKLKLFPRLKIQKKRSSTVKNGLMGIQMDHQDHEGPLHKLSKPCENLDILDMA